MDDTPYQPKRTLAAKIERRRVQWHAARPHTVRPSRAMVSFTFDDFPVSAGTIGAAALEAEGVRATFYLAGGLIGTSPAHAGPIATTDLVTSLAERGHEIGAHSFAHQDLANMSLTEIDADFARLDETLGGLGLEADTLAWPFGETRRDIKDALSPRFRAARGILPGLNIGRLDLAQLRAIEIGSTPDMEARALALLDDAIRKKAWIIFLSHDVGENAGPWGCRPAFLRELARIAVQSGAYVAPVSKCLDVLGIAGRKRSSAQQPVQPRAAGGDRPVVSVVIPTFHRPDGVLRAVRSVFAQKDAPTFEVIAVDNSAEGSASQAFRTLSGEAGAVQFQAVFEPRPGVANARNAGLRAAQGDFIAFLDDDEEATADWLKALHEVAEGYGACAVFGPVNAILPDGVGDAAEQVYLTRFYSRSGGATSGLTGESHGCGNAMVRVSALPSPEPFDATSNERGGEDDLLFAEMAARAACFAWAADAGVFEHVPMERTEARYLIKRAFAFGQGPSETAWARRDIFGLAKWTIVGAAQTLVFLPLWGLAHVANHPKRLALRERAIKGAGKVFWFFPQRFYGASAAVPRPVNAATSPSTDAMAQPR
jgi:succinoglycan biosynthesis protein ExoM